MAAHPFLQSLTDFVNAVANDFVLGPNATRIALVVFSGWMEHLSVLAGYPDCPVGTYFELNGRVGGEEKLYRFLKQTSKYTFCRFQGLCLSHQLRLHRAQVQNQLPQRHGRQS